MDTGVERHEDLARGGPLVGPKGSDPSIQTGGVITHFTVEDTGTEHRWPQLESQFAAAAAEPKTCLGVGLGRPGDSCACASALPSPTDRGTWLPQPAQRPGFRPRASHHGHWHQVWGRQDVSFVGHGLWGFEDHLLAAPCVLGSLGRAQPGRLW